MNSRTGEMHDQAAGGRVHFQWRNCFGDVIAGRFDVVIRDYWSKVVMPALSSAEAEVVYWANSDEGGACFVHSDRIDQRAITAAAMCLSIQSIWERQLRRYLLTCVGYASEDSHLRELIQKESWKKLQALFLKVRGVPMTAFLTYPDLDLLSTLGNACRHGDGASATSLWNSHPELWPAYCRDPIVLDVASIAGRKGAPSVSEMNIETSLLERLVGAIASFWEMVGYLYHESLRGKHCSLEARLIRDRQKLALAISHFNSLVD